MSNKSVQQARYDLAAEQIEREARLSASFLEHSGRAEHAQRLADARRALQEHRQQEIDRDMEQWQRDLKRQLPQR